MTYRKIGGIHWLTIGSFRIAFCRKRKPRPTRLPNINQYNLEMI